jgi:hypothetical protein
VKKDTEIKRYMQARHKGATQQVAAARAGISERTARRYEQAGKLPSERKLPLTWRTRANPFEEDWPWVVAELKRDPALQGTTLFALLCERHPQRYQPIQVRTLRASSASMRARFVASRTFSSWTRRSPVYEKGYISSTLYIVSSVTGSPGQAIEGQTRD